MIKYRKIFLQLFIASLLISINSKSLAGLTGSFKPAKNATPSDQRRTISTGSRFSCQINVEPRMLELLVPEQQVVHRTSQKNPNLYIYSHTTQLIQLDFILTDLSKTKPIYQTPISINSLGVKSISLPPEVQLEEETYYTWSLATPCQNNQNLYETVLIAGIEYSPNPTLVKEIRSTKLISDKIQIYAENGIWYEAIELAIKYRNELGYKNHLQTFNTFFYGKETN